MALAGKRVEMGALGTAHAQGDAWSRAGIGTVVRGCATVDEAVQKAGLDFTVEKWPHYFQVFEGMSSTLKVHKGSFALVRTDTRAPLATVGAGYEPFQPRELVDLVTALAHDGAVQPVEVAGSLAGGKRVFLLTPLAPTVLRGVDTVHKSLWFSAGNDGNTGVSIRFATLRASCLNSLFFGDTFTFNAAHTATLAAKVRAVKELLLRMPEAEATASNTIRALAGARLSPEKVRSFMLKLYADAFAKGAPRDAFYTELASMFAVATDAEKSANPKYAHAVDTLGAWQANLESPLNVGNDGELGNGTVWHALNAVTQWVDHGRKSTPQGRANLAHVVGGPALVKAKALKLALEYAGIAGKGGNS
jgi:phage/plasmid-like protein (TIGR03299 family)